MTLDHLASLMFLAGFLAATGLGLLVSAVYQHVQIVRYRRRRDEDPLYPKIPKRLLRARPPDTPRRLT